MAGEAAKESRDNFPGGEAQPADTDSLESCVFGLFNEIIGLMNKDISELLRPKTSAVASSVSSFQAAMTTKTSEIEQLQENTAAELATAAVAVQEFQNRMASELGAIPTTQTLKHSM